MKLTLEQLKTITFGAVHVYNDPEGVTHWQRMTNAQVDAYGVHAAILAERAMATTGCRLDFMTDSDHVVVQSASGGKYEILVNGLFAEMLQGIGRICITLPQGENRVSILLPDHDPGTLSLVKLDEGATFTPYRYDHKFLFLGDSITQGWESSRPSTSYVNHLGSFFHAQITNWGVGGSFFEANTLAPVDFTPDKVFFAYGTNDYTHWQSRAEFEAACDAYMARVKALFPHCPVYCISPIWRQDGLISNPAGTHAQVRDYLIRCAESYGFIHVDGYTLVPHHSDYYADKFLHPNDLGFAVYAQNLIKAIQK